MAEGSANTDVGVGNDTLTVDALQSSSESQACNDGGDSTDKDSQVLEPGPLDALARSRCSAVTGRHR